MVYDDNIKYKPSMTKEIWQQNVRCDPGLNPKQMNKQKKPHNFFLLL